jgi:hypothetical protein
MGSAETCGLQGTVLAVNAIASTITISQPGNDAPVTITTDGNTAFWVNGVAGTLASVLVGMNARIEPLSALQVGTATLVKAWTAAPPSQAQQMLTLYTNLLSQCAGVKSVNVDGTDVSVNDIRWNYEFWRRRVAQEQRGRNGRPRVARIKLG